MSQWSAVFLSVLQTAAVSMMIYFWQRKVAKRDRCAQTQAQARKRESLLSLNMQYATAQLSYATAVALERGSVNGEVKAGKAAYEAAKTEYERFLQEQTAEYLM